MRFLRLTWPRVHALARRLAQKAKGYAPDLLVGISRGGLVPVRLLSDFLGIRNIAIMKIEFYEDIGQPKHFPQITQPLSVDVEGKRVLLVDDVADTGRSLAVAREYLKQEKAREVRIATLHYKPQSILKPDYFAETTDAWIVYPWEVQETKRLTRRKRREVKK